MTLYPALKVARSDKPERREWKIRTAQRLLDLRAALKDHIFSVTAQDGQRTHDRDDDCWVRIATWNLREFDTDKYGGRRKEALYFIAEVISHFDLVAIQEAREDMGALKKVMRILGEHEWAYIATDVTGGASGNHERMVFVYNTTRVWFRNIAGEITLEKKKRISYPHEVHFVDTKGLRIELPKGKKLVSPKSVSTKTRSKKTKLDGDLFVDLPEGTKVTLPKGSRLMFPDGTQVQHTGKEGEIKLSAAQKPQLDKAVMVDLPKSALKGDSLQFARTPFLVAFQAGWLKFILCTVHIYYGSGKKGLARRNEEIRKLTDVLAERAESEIDSDARNHFFVLGDFNIVGKDHATWESLHTRGFKVPDELAELPKGSNVKRDKAYDQIAYWADAAKGWKGNTKVDAGRAGIFDFFKYVFRYGKDDPNNEDADYYAGDVKKTKLTYKEWRTYQMSDHLPMWIELRTDFGDDYLQRIASKKK